MNNLPGKPLDVSAGLEEFDNNIEFYTDLINGFLEHVEKRILLMEQAVSEKDMDVLKVEAHAIKGGAANLNAHDLSNAALRFEKTISPGDVSGEYEAGFDAVKKEFFRLKDFLTNHKKLNISFK